MNLPTFSFSQIEAFQPEWLTKTFKLLPDGKSEKIQGGELVLGLYLRPRMDMPAFLEYLKQLTPQYALMYGIAAHHDAIILSARAFERWKKQPEDILICRNMEYIKWCSGAGILMLDYDVEKDRKPLSKDELLSVYYEVWPALKERPHIWAPSASSCVYYPDGRVCTPVKGQRLLVPIKQSMSVPTILKNLQTKLWCTDQGFIRIGEDGSQLVRSAVDICTGQPNRLDFMGGARCLDGLYQRRAGLITGYNLDRDFLPYEQFPNVTADEEWLFQRKVELAKRRTAKKAREVKRQWVINRADADFANLKENERTDEQYRRIVKGYRKAAEGILHGNHPLWSATFKKWVTVNAILDNVENYHATEFADPNENVADKRVAFAVLKGVEKPYLYTHLHFGKRYYLERGVCNA